MSSAMSVLRIWQLSLSMRSIRSSVSAAAAAADARLRLVHILEHTLRCTDAHTKLLALRCLGGREEEEEEEEEEEDGGEAIAKTSIPSLPSLPSLASRFISTTLSCRLDTSRSCAGASIPPTGCIPPPMPLPLPLPLPLPPWWTRPLVRA